MDNDPFGLGILRPNHIYTADNPANDAYEKLEKLAKEFQDNMGDDFEFGIFAQSGNQSIRIYDIGHFGTNIMLFAGVDPNGNDFQIIQHVSQLSLTFVKIPKTNETTHRPIGFIKEPE